MKSKLVILLISCSLLCSGCQAEKITRTNIREIDSGMSGYSYIIDERTGVVYLKYSVSYKCALTVMLNADGTPITSNQLELDK